MRILIVEDDGFKQRQITEFVGTRFEDAHIEVAASVKSAEMKLSKHVFNIVLLDMSLPTFDVSPWESGGRPQGFGGRAVLDFMLYRGLEAKAVVLTQFENFSDGESVVDLDALRNELSQRYHQILLGTIFFDGAIQWQLELSKLLDRQGASS